jgi:hypothetical protein
LGARACVERIAELSAMCAQSVPERPIIALQFAWSVLRVHAEALHRLMRTRLGNPPGGADAAFEISPTVA